MAEKSKDPTVRSGATADTAPGTHPARPVDEADDAASTKEYRDNPDKPDASTIAQIEVRPDEK